MRGKGREGEEKCLGQGIRYEKKRNGVSTTQGTAKLIHRRKICSQEFINYSNRKMLDEYVMYYTQFSISYEIE